MKKLVFTDWNGDKYYQDDRGSLYHADGRLCDTETEENVKNILGYNGEIL